MKRVGVIGGGQLAWMMGGAAQKLGLQLVVQTPNVEDPAVAIAASQQCSHVPVSVGGNGNGNGNGRIAKDFLVQARVDDAMGTVELAKKSDVITFENEFVDLEALTSLAERGVCFRPRLEALAPLLDKFHQRQYLHDLGIPVPQFIALDPDDVDNDAVLGQFGFPVVLKARRHGYDGQGTHIAQSLEELREILHRYPFGATTYLLESFVPFERELAVIAARSVNGEVVIYPVVETKQIKQVCRWVIVPADIEAQMTAEINHIATQILESLDVVGVFGIELFLTQEHLVLVNEIAPRTHNSGHFSLDACETSQFEQHLRAVCGLPLGNCTLLSPGAVMVNLLGYENSHSDYQEKRNQIAQIANAHIHWYSKSVSRPGRKLGHVTVLLPQADRDNAIAVAQEIEAIWYPK
ncbi:5-(carboxyamino)imidazole ribonucleotide synthase [Calothrix sp. NIES-3974]|uniref:5-(carboxyamino)imidazole ribonucleotide synthase n=1 Tax=Calothrix sp. NIES-3974 TaxID=2005462 RepID=UPI000B5ED159|nr:5-(carboxyamino)imidazole ribonucleotide synthase [Calothrix sp. NIES-3974]BAZ07612.1 phosphoribosylaminoimidazole carboxylase ATPase subunit [Calothrix sp. NIES-3974]